MCPEQLSLHPLSFFYKKEWREFGEELRKSKSKLKSTYIA